MSDDSFEDSQPLPPPGPPDLHNPRRRMRPADNGHVGRVDRLPPHSPEAEQGVLGCILTAPKDTLPTAIAKLNANDQVFYDLRHQTIFSHLMMMADSDISSIDVITVQQRLKDFGLLDEVGGIPYLNALQDGVPSAFNLGYYLDIVLEKFLLRKAIQVCTDSVSRIYASESEPDVLMDEMEREVLSVRRNIVSTDSFGMKELVPGTINRIEAMWESKGQSVFGIATGFPDLDRMTGGLQNGDMIVIAARPSMGKTSLAMNIADHVAVTEKIPVGVFSLEMTKEAMTDRMVCSRARVNLRNIREGFLTERDFPKLTTCAGQISNSPLRIDDTPALSIMALRARARSMWQQFGIKLFVIDYLQLLHATSRRAQDNRQQEVTEISGGVKALAKELGVPVIILSQLNREMEKDKHRRPRLSDLRESGAIEQDADVVGMLYKVKTEGDDEDGGEEPDGIPVNLLIAKQRNGPCGDVNLTFLKPYTRFESAAKVSEDDVPADDGRSYKSSSPDP